MLEHNSVMHSRPSMAAPIPIATYALDTVALAILSNALLHLVLLDETTLPNIHQQGNTLLQSLNAVVYAIYGLRLIFNTAVKSQLRILINNDRLFCFPVAVLLGLAFASMLWSGEPQVTFRRAFALAGTTLVGIYLALRYTPRQFLMLLLGVSAVFALSSIAMVMLWPQKGLMQVSTVFADVHKGRWRGIFVHKNHLASLMAVGIVTATGLLTGRGKQLLAAGLMLLVCLGLLLLAESLTSLLATATALLAISIVRMLPGRQTMRREILLALTPLVLLIVSVVLYQSAQNKPDASTPVTTAQVTETANSASSNSQHTPLQREGFRRDAGATGRLNMWRWCWDAIQQQPLLGYGYGTFWRTGGPAERVWKHTRFRLPHAHNGWIDLALQLGLPATLLTAGWMLWLGARLLRGVYQDGEHEAQTAAIALFGLWVCLNVLNLAESVVFRQNDVLSALLLSVAVFTALPRKTHFESTFR
ncbi:MAG: O-antigen ligase family protein [Halioglobus sp.]